MHHIRKLFPVMNRQEVIVAISGSCTEVNTRAILTLELAAIERVRSSDKVDVPLTASLKSQCIRTRHRLQLS